MRISPNLRIFITGKTQSGKSFFCKWLLRQYENLLVYDLKREYTAFGVVVRSLDQLRRAVGQGYNRIVYQPVDLSAEHFDLVCDFVFSFLRNLVFVVDEVHVFCSKHCIPQNFKNLITVAQGSPYFIGVISISQRPANVHNDVLGNSSLIVSFRLSLFADAEAVSSMTDIPVEELQGLEYYWFYVYNDREKENVITKHEPI